MPHVVAKEIISILRKFLYVGDDEEKRKIYWDRVCCLKGHGWLGIKNIYLFNIALMENGDGLCFVSKKCFGWRFWSLNIEGGEVS